MVSYTREERAKTTILRLGGGGGGGGGGNTERETERGGGGGGKRLCLPTVPYPVVHYNMQSSNFLLFVFVSLMF